MADTITDNQTPPVDPVVTEPVDAQTEPTEAEKEMQAKLEALELENKRIKGTMSATDKKLLALQKEKDELAKKTMSDEERRTAEFEADRKVLVDETKEFFKDALKLDAETDGLIDGKTAQEVKEKSAMLKGYKDAVLKESSEKIEALEKEITVLKGEMPNPGSGKTASGSKRDVIKAQIAEAEKAGNGDLAFALMEQLQNTPE
jgi:hypothetical protein